MTDLSSLIDLLTNATVALLIQWFCSGIGQKSTVKVQHLIEESPCMRTSLVQELGKLDTFELSLEDKDWKKDSINISMLAQEQGHWA